MKIFIYCIYNNNFKKQFYIGSTKKYKKRMREHKSNCYNQNRRKYNYTLYKFIRENGGWSEFSKIIIATVDVANKLEQLKIEQVYLDHLEPGLNNLRSYRTPEQLKKWYNTKKICICGCKYTNVNKSRHERSKKHKNYLLKNTKTNLINKYINSI